MGNIVQAFKNGKALAGFVTGGDPSVEKSGEFILAMAESGANIVEIGIPFSDPVAEGTLIQEANIRALRGGATTEKLFTLAKSVRAKTPVPLVFFTYLNPVFHYGYEAFFERCKSCGLDGIIIPDLPFEEQGEVRGSAEKYGIDLVSLIAPAPEERITAIAKTAAGFVYIVPSRAAGGGHGETVADISALVSKVRAVTDIPAAVEFSGSNPEEAAELAATPDGVIAGSAIVNIVARHGEKAGPEIRRFVRSMKVAIQQV